MENLLQSLDLRWALLSVALAAVVSLWLLALSHIGPARRVELLRRETGSDDKPVFGLYIVRSASQFFGRFGVEVAVCGLLFSLGEHIIADPWLLAGAILALRIAGLTLVNLWLVKRVDAITRAGNGEKPSGE